MTPDAWWADDGRDRSWVRSAACRGLAPAEVNRMFFSPRGSNADIAEGKAICAACPVRVDCLDYGLSERFGLWGGLSERERKRVRRQRRAA